MKPCRVCKRYTKNVSRLCDDCTEKWNEMVKKAKEANSTKRDLTQAEADYIMGVRDTLPDRRGR